MKPFALMSGSLKSCALKSCAARPFVLRFCLFATACLAWLAAPGTAGAQTAVSIHDIMVASPGITGYTTYFLPDSYYLYSHYGQAVSVTGVVVGVESTGDFTGTVYISEFSSNSTQCSSNSNYCWDNAVATAEGMPVFNVASVNSACAAIGATITVVGDVVESNSVVPADITAADTPGTGLLPTSCTVTATGGTMTQSISLGTTLNSFGGSLEYTGMTTSATFYAVSPAGSTKSATTGAVTSTGQFWATLSSNTTTNNHLFRSAGIAPDEYEPVSGVTTWAGNPQRILIDTTTFGGSPVNLTVGQSITCATGSNIKVGATAGIGLIDYTLGYARLLIFPTSVCTVSGTVQAINSATSDSTHFHVGTLDLNGLATTDVDYSTRLPKAVVAIETNLGQPDIVSLQEVADATTLSALASAINTAAGTSYQAYLYPGTNAGSLNLGFLVNTATVTVDTVNQVEENSTYTTTSGSTATLWSQPPLVLKAEFVRSIGPSYPITVINTLFTGRTSIGDTTLGPDIRNHRAAEATDMSKLVQSYESADANVIVAGNLNAFEFSDGYVDVTGIIKGSPAASGKVTLYEPTSTTNALTDFVASTATSRYNYIERGDAVMYEHILASNTVLDSTTASTSLAAYETTITQPHFTADYPAATYAATTTSAAGLTPHDGLVVAFLIPPAPTTAAVSPTTLNFGNVNLGASATLTATFTNTTTFVSTVTVSGISISGTNAADYAETNTCTAALPMGSSCTITVTFTPSAIGSRTGTMTTLSNSTSDPSLTVSLIGNGTDTTATLTPSTYTFPDTGVGATSAAEVFTFTNTSATVSETVGTPSVSGDYSITANTCAGVTIAVTATCTISVVFTPTVAGSRTGTLTVPNSSTGDPTLTAALGGTGLPTTATLTPATATFASTDISATTAAQTFTVTNTSPNSLAITINKPTITGDFTITATTCGGSLAAGATCTVSVPFAPTAASTRTGVLTVTNTSSADPTLTATLNGTGLDTTATLTPSSATFANTYAGGGVSAAQVFTLTNTSAIAITVKSIALSSTNFTQSATTCGTTLAAGASCTISVTFTPLTSGALTGTLTVTNSTTADPTLVSTLNGTGLPTTATLTPASATYPNTIVGVTSSALAFVWTNTSAIALKITSVTPSGDFAVSSTTCSGSVAANSSCTIYVTFTPTVLGARTGTLTVVSTSSANGTLTSTLAGRGVADVEASVSAIDFGNIDLGTSSAPQTITITNYTNATIALTSLALSGSDYAYTTTCGSTIAGLSTCTVTFTFTPSALGTRTGTFVVNTNDTKYPVITIALTGTGVDFSVAVTPSSGSMIAGFYQTVTLTLTPLGGFSAPVALSCTTTADGSACTPSSTTATLSATVTMPVKITTTSQYTVIGYGGWSRWLALAGFASGIGLLLGFRRRGFVPRLVAMFLLAVALGLGTTGCGTTPARNTSVTAPGTYTYTFSVTDGTITRTGTYTLTVTAD